MPTGGDPTTLPQDLDTPGSQSDIQNGILDTLKQPLYKHFKGGWYCVLRVEADAAWAGGYKVHYLSMHFGTTHDRSAAEFFGYVERIDPRYHGLRFIPHPEPIPATANPAWMAQYGHLVK